MADPSVEIHLFAAARAAVSASVLNLPAGTLFTILDRIESDYPAFTAVRPRCSYLIDGVSAHGDIDIASGSRVDVLPPFAGG